MTKKEDIYSLNIALDINSQVMRESHHYNIV